MRRHTSLKGRVLMAAAAAVMATAGGARLDAANINDLRESYFGSLFANSASGPEDSPFSFGEFITSANGKFSGTIGGDVPITGKVTSSGKITFSGTFQSGGQTLKFKNGKGQLSATGRFIVGSVTVQSVNSELPSGKYTFAVQDSTPF